MVVGRVVDGKASYHRCSMHVVGVVDAIEKVVDEKSSLGVRL